MPKSRKTGTIRPGPSTTDVRMMRGGLELGGERLRRGGRDQERRRKDGDEDETSRQRGTSLIAFRE